MRAVRKGWVQLFPLWASARKKVPDRRQWGNYGTEMEIIMFFVDDSFVCTYQFAVIFSDFFASLFLSCLKHQHPAAVNRRDGINISDSPENE